MTNLSKKLCKVCGIPYILLEDNCRVYDNNGELCEQYVHKLNFEQPENFVKLFNLQLYQTTLAAIITYDSIILNTRDFISSVIQELKDTHYDTSEIKQAIRDEEWIYE